MDALIFLCLLFMIGRGGGWLLKEGGLNVDPDGCGCLFISLTLTAVTLHSLFWRG